MENCPICLNEMNLDTQTSTQCRHQFCENCLNTWLENHNTCPLCRYVIYEMEDNEDSDDERDFPIDFAMLLLQRVMDRMVNRLDRVLIPLLPENQQEYELQRILEQDAYAQRQRYINMDEPEEVELGIIPSFSEESIMREDHIRRMEEREERHLVIPMMRRNMVVREWRDDNDLGRPQQSIYNHIRRIREAERRQSE